MLTITEIKRLMEKFDFRPKKKAGQHFIIDRNIVDKLIRFADIGNEDLVLEIGAGIGNITRDIANVAKTVYALEFDKVLCNVLKTTLSGYVNIKPICQNILKFDFKAYGQKQKLRIIGNLPYYITTPILERIIENKDYIEDALLMVQKEMAERMLAKHGGKTYSPITCYVQYYTRPELKSIVKRNSFFPKPEVDSVLIYLKVLDTPSISVNNEKLFFKIVKTTFNQRRKMLSSSLGYKKRLGVDKEQARQILLKAGVAADKRPEALSLEEFARITNEFPG
ncbi:MAG: ribosomal RNA small subunit methyltransferase A [Candidatus Omnitrophica bacterium]|nr:ribosomal RNA small subunit methyltransferase A [Candidatus Omnitrophota bacterium]